MLKLVERAWATTAPSFNGKYNSIGAWQETPKATMQT